MEYIIISFIVFSAAYVKVLLTYGFDIPFILPLGIILVDSFARANPFGIKFMVDWEGFEPPTSAMPRRHSYQLNYQPVQQHIKGST
jgi:hypothetical protein